MLQLNPRPQLLYSLQSGLGRLPTLRRIYLLEQRLAKYPKFHQYKAY
jgi:hypothetical protein